MRLTSKTNEAMFQMQKMKKLYDQNNKQITKIFK